ncbi:beta-lactamase-like protein 2 homolog isoform X2 [Ptiloglossa arizonensis]
METAEQYTTILRQVLEEEKATIEHLIITHWHGDHIGGANAVQNLIKTMNPTKTSTIWKFPRSPEDTGMTKAEESTNWQALTNKQIVKVQGAKLCVEYTPGHTSDHVSLMLEDEGILFSGDCILGERTTVFEDLHSYMASLNKILAMKPQVIYPGHGTVINDSIANINFYIQHRQKREAEILEFLQNNSKNSTLSEMDIAKHIYTDLSDTMRKAAAYNIEHHLCKLLKEGKVKGEKGKWQSL